MMNTLEGLRSIWWSEYVAWRLKSVLKCINIPNFQWHSMQLREGFDPNNLDVASIVQEVPDEKVS